MSETYLPAEQWQNHWLYRVQQQAETAKLANANKPLIVTPDNPDEWNKGLARTHDWGGAETETKSDGLKFPAGAVYEDPMTKAIHICRDENSPALCGAFNNKPPQFWPDYARWVRLSGKIQVTTCHRCHSLAGYTESPGEFR